MTTIVKQIGEEREQFTLIPEDEKDKKAVDAIRWEMKYDLYDLETGRLQFTRKKLS